MSTPSASWAGRAWRSMRGRVIFTAACALALGALLLILVGPGPLTLISHPSDYLSYASIEWAVWRTKPDSMTYTESDGAGHVLFAYSTSKPDAVSRWYAYVNGAQPIFPGLQPLHRKPRRAPAADEDVYLPEPWRGGRDGQQRRRKWPVRLLHAQRRGRARPVHLPPHRPGSLAHAAGRPIRLRRNRPARSSISRAPRPASHQACANMDVCGNLHARVLSRIFSYLA